MTARAASWPGSRASTRPPMPTTTPGRSRPGRSPEAGRRSYAYDAGGRLTETTLPSNSLYRFAYDADSNLTRVTPPITNTHALTYTRRRPAVGLLASRRRRLRLELQSRRGADRGDPARAASLRLTARTPAGAPRASATPARPITFVYTDATSRVRGIVRTPADPGAGQSISFTYAGGYVTGLDWSGVATGTYTYTYGANTRLTGITLRRRSQDHAGLRCRRPAHPGRPLCVHARRSPRQPDGDQRRHATPAPTPTMAMAAFSGRGAAVAGQDLYQEQLDVRQRRPHPAEDRDRPGRHSDLHLHL